MRGEDEDDFGPSGRVTRSSSGSEAREKVFKRQFAVCVIQEPVADFRRFQRPERLRALLAVLPVGALETMPLSREEQGVPSRLRGCLPLPSASSPPLLSINRWSSMTFGLCASNI